MQNQLSKLNKFFEKIAQFSEMTDQEKASYFSDINEGLTGYLISDGKDAVAPETYQKLTQTLSATPKDQNQIKLIVSAYLKELSENEKGQEIIAKRIEELINDVAGAIKEKLTESQRDELIKILE